MWSHLAEKKPEVQECAEEKTKGEREEGEGEKTEAGKEEQREEGEETSVSVEAELARMEERWREQCIINDNLKLLLADEEQRFKVIYAHTFHCACTQTPVWRLKFSIFFFLTHIDYQVSV